MDGGTIFKEYLMHLQSGALTTSLSYFH